VNMASAKTDTFQELITRFLSDRASHVVLIDDQHDLLGKLDHEEIGTEHYEYEIITYDRYRYLNFRKEYETSRETGQPIVIALSTWDSEQLTAELGDILDEQGISAPVELTPTDLLREVEFPLILDAVADNYLSEHIKDFISFCKWNGITGRFNREETIELLLYYASEVDFRNPVDVNDQYKLATEKGIFETSDFVNTDLKIPVQGILETEAKSRLPKIAEFAPVLSADEECSRFANAVWTVRCLNSLDQDLDWVNALLESPPDEDYSKILDLALELDSDRFQDQVDQVDKDVDRETLRTRAENSAPSEAVTGFLLPTAASAICSQTVDSIVEALKVETSHETVLTELRSANHDVDKLSKAVGFTDRFASIDEEIDGKLSDANRWLDIFQNLSELGHIVDEIDRQELVWKFEDLWQRADQSFCDAVDDHYLSWIHNSNVTLSWDILDEYILEAVEEYPTVYVIVFDGLRFDHWLGIRETLNDTFFIVEDHPYVSILPTATPYARNTLLTGKSPRELEHEYGKYLYNVGNADEEDWFRDSTGLHGDDLKYQNPAGVSSKRRKAERIMKSGARVKSLIYHFSDKLTHNFGGQSSITSQLQGDRSFRQIPVQFFKDNIAHQITQIPNIDPSNQGAIILISDHGATRADDERRVNNYDAYKSGTRYARGGPWEKPKGCHLAMDSTSEEYRLPEEDFIFAKHRTILTNSDDDDRYVHGGISLHEMLPPVALLTW